MATIPEIAAGVNLSSGTSGVAAYALYSANATAIAAAEAASKVSLQGVVNSFLLAAGYAKQFDLAAEQGRLADAQRDAVGRNITLTERNYTELALPAYKQAETYFHQYYRKTWEPRLLDIAKCGLANCEYTPDYNRWIQRGIVDVAKVINGAKATAKRALDPYSAGLCCDIDYRFADLQARLTVDTINLGRVHEDERKLRIDQFYWNKLTTTANLINSIGVMAGNMNQYGKQGIASALQLQTSAISGFDNAVQSGFSALGQSANLYGSLGRALGDNRGTAQGREVGQGILGNVFTTLEQARASNVAAQAFIPGGEQFTGPPESARTDNINGFE
jgi:hypothetical protein